MTGVGDCEIGEAVEVSKVACKAVQGKRNKLSVHPSPAAPPR